MPAQTGLWRTLRCLWKWKSNAAVGLGLCQLSTHFPDKSLGWEGIRYFTLLCLGAARFGQGLGCAPAVITQFQCSPCASSCCRSRAGALGVTVPAKVSLGEPMLRTTRLLDPLDPFPFPGSVQGRLRLCVARSCLDQEPITIAGCLEGAGVIGCLFACLTWRIQSCE